MPSSTVCSPMKQTEMPAFRLTPQAQQDLLAIRHFTIEHWGQAQSRRYLEQLREVMHHLADMPEAGKAHFHDLGEEIHSFPYASHRIYYRNRPAGITVLTILHQAMVPHRHLEQRL
ncbi:TPA: type II toxin-antitoxin system RelE/ParE family toxin [Serratia marcescens]|uniref:type II toxin-antitoxin system RelE/ParE family toxin n=3 Tax=Serratia TaxID=613 RepID=UPI0009A53E3A|nr:type II toxin-antitoxin system RelE/ParE family toxin [Serratia marcescens]EKX2168582.1 type II toxin-antitoxin system RelE/ParE family toxin [Serratia marcescens]MBN5290335.1 type II toxin-antitoxin system RelE/ParE family toxin [Serratia marcescens]MDP8723477.1 type II toxin-antitoxin system RelE/ParE family toxin [Serratia marcescens]UMK49295.1 type II toxin-antitoxin system RelE/ParE family toxin [Serratia marcescens]CAB5627303.1 Gyrase inhibitor ParE [Serratia marcescens]